MARRLCKLARFGLIGKDLTLSCFTKRIQPLQNRDRLMCFYSGRDDTMRVTKDNLSSDALDKRLRVMIKIARDVHSHACNFDIYTEDAGPSVSNFRPIIIPISCLQFCLRTLLIFTARLP
jgi:hypothetical protein